MVKGKTPRTQIKVEYLTDIRYRVYVDIKDMDMYEKLKYNLENHISFYTCSFGLSENLANFEYAGEYKYEKFSGDTTIDSVINLDLVDRESIVIDIEKEYFTDRFPMEMKEDREVVKYGDILFERCGAGIEVKDTSYLKIENGRNILWY